MCKTATIFFVLFVNYNAFANFSQISNSDTAKPTVSLRATNNPIDSNILIVINGIPAGTIRELKKDISTLFPTDIIESIFVWKAEKAIEKFGEKGKDGVIEFQLKKDVVVSDLKLTSVNTTSADAIFEKVDIEAKFPGGDAAWRKFLERTLNPNITVDNGAPAGTYKAIVQFIVDRDGNLLELKPLTSYGYGIEKEVTRVMKLSPKWEPAIANGRIVKAYRKQPVTFVVSFDFDISLKNIEAGKETEIEVVDYNMDKNETLEATLSNGTIKALGEKKFLIKADSPGVIIFTLFSKKKKETTEQGQFIIEVK